MDPSRGLSRSVEDYLKAVYALTEQGDAASTSALAQSLDVQPASVTGMVKRLAEQGFVEHVPYKGVRLTAVGRGAALRIVRRHRILETFLVEHLGFSWEEVHDEAELLEHAASDRLVEHMAAALEHPSHDPHGAPIPTRSGEIEAVDFTTLADAGEGDDVNIRAVADEDAERLRYLEARGLTPGVRLRVQETAPFDGPVTVRVGGAAGPRQVVGHEMARRIFVTSGR